MVLNLPDAVCGPLIQFLMWQWPPSIKLFSLLLQYCNFASVINCNVNIWYVGHLTSIKRLVNPQEGPDQQVKSHCFKALVCIQFALCFVFVVKDMISQLPHSATWSVPPTMVDSYSSGTLSLNSCCSLCHSYRKVINTTAQWERPCPDVPSLFIVTPVQPSVNTYVLGGPSARIYIFSRQFYIYLFICIIVVVIDVIVVVVVVTLFVCLCVFMSVM